MNHARLKAFAFIALCAGCGGPSADIVPVVGKVTLDGQPLDHANVTFYPEGKGPVVTGFTDASGQFKLLYPGGFEGAPPGKYRVTVEHYTMKDGSPPNYDLPGEDPNSYDQLRAGGALKSTLGPNASDPAQTLLSADVSSSNRTFTFDLQKPSQTK